MRPILIHHFDTGFYSDASHPQDPLIIPIYHDFRLFGGVSAAGIGADSAGAASHGQNVMKLMADMSRRVGIGDRMRILSYKTGDARSMDPISLGAAIHYATSAMIPAHPECDHVACVEHTQAVLGLLNAALSQLQARNVACALPAGEAGSTPLVTVGVNWDFQQGYPPDNCLAITCGIPFRGLYPWANYGPRHVGIAMAAATDETSGAAAELAVMMAWELAQAPGLGYRDIIARVMARSFKDPVLNGKVGCGGWLAGSWNT